jgi:hypothetical protein
MVVKLLHRKNTDRGTRKYSIACINSKLRRFEDTKGLIKIRKSKKERQDNGQKKKDKKTNNDLKTYT